MASTGEGMGAAPSAVVKPAVILPPSSSSSPSSSASPPSSSSSSSDSFPTNDSSSTSITTSTNLWISPTSCTYIFDSLWFCLSPVYQAKEYYISGDFDSCEEKASALYMCLSNKVKKDPDMNRKIEAKLKRKPIQPCWTKRGEGRGDEVEETAPVWELKEKPGWY